MTQDPKNLLALLERQQKSLRRAMRRPNAINRRIKATLEKLRAEIGSGKTTGDAILDHVIFHYGWSKETAPIEKFYRAMDEKFRASVGQFVLLRHNYQHQYCHRDPGPFHEGDFMSRAHYYLGIIREGGLILGKAPDYWKLPTAKYLAMKESIHRVIVGDIQSPLLIHCGLYLLLTSQHLSESIELWVGDDEVRKSGHLAQIKFDALPDHLALLGREL